MIIGPYDLSNLEICPWGNNKRDDILYTLIRLHYATAFHNDLTALNELMVEMWKNYNDTYRDLLITWLRINWHFLPAPPEVFTMINTGNNIEFFFNDSGENDITVNISWGDGQTDTDVILNNLTPAQHSYYVPGPHTVAVTIVSTLPDPTLQLSISGMDITALDVSAITRLALLSAYNCLIDTLTLSASSLLTVVSAAGNCLTEQGITDIIEALPTWPPYTGYITIVPQLEGFAQDLTQAQRTALEAKGWEIAT